MTILEMRSRRAIAGILLSSLVVALLSAGGTVAAQEPATPTVPYSCDSTTLDATPVMAHNRDAGMMAGTPMAGMDMEFDLHYIDMMIPHHEGIVALAQAALPEVTDPRLTEIAQQIIDAQTMEQEELRSYREEWYGSGDPMPVDMDMMMQMMPGMMMSPEEMAQQMNPDAMVASFCAAADPDLAFIDLVIPHHESAIAVSQTALEQATHEELKAFAQRVIDDQQREIDELTAIRAELTAGATPTA